MLNHLKCLLNDMLPARIVEEVIRFFLFKSVDGYFPRCQSYIDDPRP